MSTTLKTAVITTAAILTATSAIAEETVVLDHGIVGTLTLPEGGARGPAVVMLHGFASSRDEIGGLFATQAGMLAERGIAALRIDFRGFGDSAGEAADMTVERLVEDAQIARKYLAEVEGVEPSRIGAVSYSFGSAIAMLDADAYRSLVAWGQMGDLYGEFHDFLGQAAFDQAASEGHATIDMGWSSITLKHGFFESIGRFDLAQAFSGYAGHFLTIAGEDDPAVDYFDSFTGMAAHSSAIVVPGADHMFGVFSGETGPGERVIAETAAWLAATL